jgi:thiamine-monophosphate kinase
MGAAPIAALISLAVSRGTSKKAIRELYDGFDEIARKYKCDISGGDIVKSIALGINITVIGHARKPLLRSGALPGDSLYVTNFLGLAETGRIALQEKSPMDQYPDAIKRHLYPEPRINEAFSIAKYATACIDTSDGLSTDAFHIAEESNARIVIDAAHIPIHAEVGRISSRKGIDPTRFILSAGEDFELLFTARKLPKISHMKIFKIGSVMMGRGLYLKIKGQLQRIQPTGYEHITH